LIVASMMLGDAAWWMVADRRLRRTRHPKLWRPLLGLFSGFQLGYLLWFITFPSQGRHAHAWMPIRILASIYVWHILILPASLVLIVVSGAARAAVTRIRSGGSRVNTSSPTIDKPEQLPAIVTIPPQTFSRA